MAKNTGHSSQQSRNDGWVMVNKKVSSKGYTRSRSPPQYNGDNEPSGHKANASNSPSRNNSITFEELEGIGEDSYLPVNHKTESNGSSDTVTSGTGTPTLARTATAPRPRHVTADNSRAAVPDLTVSTLQEHMEELNHQAVIDLPDWVNQTGMDFRFAHYPGSSTYGSMAVGGSMASTAGSGGQGWYSDPYQSMGVEDIVAAGAWCDEPIDALIHASYHLKLDGE